MKLAEFLKSNVGGRMKSKPVCSLVTRMSRTLALIAEGELKTDSDVSLLRFLVFNSSVAPSIHNSTAAFLRLKGQRWGW